MNFGLNCSHGGKLKELWSVVKDGVNHNRNYEVTGGIFSPEQTKKLVKTIKTVKIEFLCKTRDIKTVAAKMSLQSAVKFQSHFQFIPEFCKGMDDCKVSFN